jgi:hypothetical protein
MALIYQAQVTPSKIELLRAWVPAQPWLGDADASTLEALGAYRFDDPEGEVGIETHLLQTASGHVLQVPLTYRSAPLAGAESSLIATLQHSVLGERWVHDGSADPVYVTALATAILTGGAEAVHDVVTDAGHVQRATTTHVTGSGSPDIAVPALGSPTCASEGTATVLRTANLTLGVLRVIDTSHVPGGRQGGAHTLTGTWPGHDAPALLAVAHLL